MSDGYDYDVLDARTGDVREGPYTKDGVERLARQELEGVMA